MVGLDLCAPRLLLGLELEAAHLLARLAHLAARHLERAVGLALRVLGAQHALARLHDARVQLLVAALAEPVQEAVVPRRPLRRRRRGRGGAGPRRPVGRVGPARRCRRRRRGVAAQRAEEAALAGLFLDQGLRLRLLVLAGEERHLDGEGFDGSGCVWCLWLVVGCVRN